MSKQSKTGGDNNSSLTNQRGQYLASARDGSAVPNTDEHKKTWFNREM